MQPVGGLRPYCGHHPGQHADSRQQHPLPPQPGHRLAEQRHRALSMRPRPPGQEPAQLRARLRVGEVPVPVRLADLPGVLVRGHRPVGVALHHRGIGDLKLASQVVDHAPRHIERIRRQERPQVANGAQLHREPQPGMRTTPPRDQLTVSVVKEEEPLQLRLRRLALEPPVPSSLLIGQELDRHTPIIGQSRPAR